MAKRRGGGAFRVAEVQGRGEIRIVDVSETVFDADRAFVALEVLHCHGVVLLSWWGYYGTTEALPLVKPTMVPPMSVPTDKTQIKFYVKRDEIRDALKRAADADMRSVSTLIEMVLTEWLEARGYLKPEKRGK